MGGSRPFEECYTHIYPHLTLTHNSSFDKNMGMEGGEGEAERVSVWWSAWCSGGGEERKDYPHHPPLYAASEN